MQRERLWWGRPELVIGLGLEQSDQPGWGQVRWGLPKGFGDGRKERQRIPLHLLEAPFGFEGENDGKKVSRRLALDGRMNLQL